MSIVAVTGESAEKTDPWIDAQGAKYPYTYLKGREGMGAMMKPLGMTGYPSAALVNPKGVVVWKGHPSAVNGSLVKKHLKGADKTPVEIRAVTKNWPKAAKSVKTAFKKGQLAKALAYAEKMDVADQGENLVAADLKRLITKRTKAAKDAHEVGNFLGFMEQAGPLSKSLKGLSEGDELSALIKSTKADKDAMKVVKAQKTLAKIKEALPEMRKDKEFKAARKKVKKIAEKQSGTYAEALAVKLLKKLDPNARRH